MTAEPEPVLRPPQQRRSRESLERVLDAGTQLLVEGGYDAFTLQEVSRRAKVSIGSIYSRASSKEVLFLAIHEREMERMAAEQAVLFAPGRWEGVPLPVLIETLVREYAAIVLRHGALLRVFMHRSAVDEEIYRRGSQRTAQVAAQFEAVLLAHEDDIRHEEPRVAIDVAFRMVFGTLSRRVTRGKGFETQIQISDARLVRELERAIVGYLLTPPA